jgi:transposase-like protein
MRYPASEKLEIIRLVEQSHLSVRRTLEKLGVLPGSFYRWYDRYQTGGVEALEDKPSKPKAVWNRIPDDVRRRTIELALDCPELSPRELATRFTEHRNCAHQESLVCVLQIPLAVVVLLCRRLRTDRSRFALRSALDAYYRVRRAREEWRTAVASIQSRLVAT